MNAQLEYCTICDTELRNDDPPTTCAACANERDKI